MANANWSNPQLTSTYTNFVSEVKNRDEDLALQFDGTTSTNIPTNTIRWDSSAGRWKKWNGTSWAELTSTYALTGLSTTGAASIGTTLAVTGTITGSSTVTGTALIPSGSSVPVNGIYLPSANSVAIATNSSQRLAIDSSGNITIPGTLAVTGAITGSSTVTSAAGSATAAGLQVGTGTTYKPGIYSPGTDQLAISTNGSGRLFVNATGEILAGTTTSVDGNWKVQANAAAGALIGIGVNNNGGYGVYLTYDNSARYSGAACLRNIANSPLAFETNNIERMRLDSSGRLGLGYSSPGSRLQSDGTGGAANATASTTATNASLALSSVNGLGTSTVLYAGVGSSSYTWLQAQNSGDNTTKDIVLNPLGGRVSIGTTSPGATFHCVGTSLFTAQQSALFNSSTGTYTTWQNNGTSIGDIGTCNQVTSGGSAGDFGITSRAGSLVLGNNSTEKVRIDTSGRLLIGTSSASSVSTSQYALLKVQGNTSSAGTQGILNLARGSAASSGLGAGSDMGVITFTDNTGGDFAQITASADATTGASSFPGRLTFSTTASGSASPTERFRISSDGSISSVIPGGTTLYPRFGCRAWVNFNGTTASPSTIRGSGNVSSVTKNGTGDYTVNFTSALADANYGITVGASSTGGYANSNGLVNAFGRNGSISSSAFRMFIVNNSNGSVDEGYVFISVFR